MSVCSSLFFFSSRRRHTRSLCDWSSDVCSSDLGTLTVGMPRKLNGRVYCVMRPTSVSMPRSEERRVGKECRSRWWRYQEKEKEDYEFTVPGKKSTALAFEYSGALARTRSSRPSR